MFLPFWKDWSPLVRRKSDLRVLLLMTLKSSSDDHVCRYQESRNNKVIKIYTIKLMIVIAVDRKAHYDFKNWLLF